MTRALYWLGLQCYRLAIGLAGTLGNSKAKLWIAGRKNWKISIQASTRQRNGPLVWFHVASLGEFEQARPVIELLKHERPSTFIFLTFFSPSGYTVRKDYQYADAVHYLPLDTPSNAHYLVETLKPVAVVFTKYDLWPELLRELDRNAVPTQLIAGRFHKGQPYFKCYGAMFKKALRTLNRIDVQDAQSKEILSGIGISEVHLTGDTRYDRVLDIVSQEIRVLDFEKILQKEALVCMIGSSWPAEEALLLDYLERRPEANLQLVLAPHDISEPRIAGLRKQFGPDCQRRSEKSSSPSSAIILDTMGELAQLYQYADVVIVGGGFGAGIHSVLEPAAWSKPILFGPRYTRFPEAVDLIQGGGARVVRDQSSFDQIMDELLANSTLRLEMGEKALGLCKENAGAVMATTAHLLEVIAHNYAK